MKSEKKPGPCPARMFSYTCSNDGGMPSMSAKEHEPKTISSGECEEDAKELPIIVDARLEYNEIVFTARNNNITFYVCRHCGTLYQEI